MANTSDPQLSMAQLLTPEYLANPYALYSQLRTQEPVFWDEQAGAWVLLRRLPDIQLATEEVERPPSTVFRGLMELPISFAQS